MEKKKHQRWKKRDFIVRQKKSKYTNRAAMKKEKAFPRQRKERTFLYILPLQIMPTMRQKKKKSTFKLFHPQNKTTENLNLRIKGAILKQEECQFRCPSLILWPQRRKTYLMSHRRRIGLSITNSSLIFDKAAVDMKKLNFLGAF